MNDKSELAISKVSELCIIDDESWAKIRSGG